MPISIPHTNEEKGEFIQRCVVDLTDKGEGETNEQRIAICNAQWEQTMIKLDLPLYELLINEEDLESGVDMVSLVDSPAMGYSYELFNNKQKFNIQSEDKRLVSGVIMLAETPIYRANPVLGEHYIKFSKDTIRDIMQKFFKNNFNLTANFNHSEDTIVKDNVYFYESFQVDKDRGIRSPEGYNLPDGSWFGTLKVEDDELWKRIKGGSFTGFSVEGMFEYGFLAQADATYKELEQLLDEIQDFIDNNL